MNLQESIEVVKKFKFIGVVLKEDKQALSVLLEVAKKVDEEKMQEILQRIIQQWVDDDQLVSAHKGWIASALSDELAHAACEWLEGMKE